MTDKEKVEILKKALQDILDVGECNFSKETALDALKKVK